jgi:hypothetical protein
MAEHRLPITEKLCGRARKAVETEREWASPPGSGSASSSWPGRLGAVLPAPRLARFGSRAPLRVSVHLSPRQLKHRVLVPAVRDLGSECACDPRHLDLEITASKTPVRPSQSSGTCARSGFRSAWTFAMGNGLQWCPVMSHNRGSRRDGPVQSKGGGKMNPLDTIVGTIAAGVVLAMILTIVIKLIAGG